MDSSRLDGCQQTLDVERVRPQTTRRPPQEANLTRLGTLRQSEEIIVPVSIRVGSQVLPATIAGIHDTDVGPVSSRTMTKKVSVLFSMLATTSSAGHFQLPPPGPPTSVIRSWVLFRSGFVTQVI